MAIIAGVLRALKWWSDHVLMPRMEEHINLLRETKHQVSDNHHESGPPTMRDELATIRKMTEKHERWLERLNTRIRVEEGKTDDAFEQIRDQAEPQGVTLNISNKDSS